MTGPLLTATAIAKSFAGIQALRGVSFDLRRGEVHALIGENGAGKSTLIRVMTGAVAADAGTLTVDGQAVDRLDPGRARALGIAAIYQQPALFPDLTVAENLALPLEPRGAWHRVDHRGRRRRARALLERLGSTLDVGRQVGGLSLPEQQVVEIARALGAEARILIMDEPTAALSEVDARRLLAIVGALRQQGVGVIYISHRLEEVEAIADRVTVLRDGETVATLPRSGLSRPALIRHMVGREMADVYPPRPRARPAGGVEIVGLSQHAAGVHDISLTIARGEILGLAGLVGSGRTELAETLFGLRRADAGTLRLDGRTVRVASPGEAIAAGIGYVPEDRRQHGIVPELSVAANTTLASLDAVSRHGWLDRAAERAAASRYVDAFRIRAASVEQAVGTLSGGNQQKVALARWLAIEPRFLILDEPTQGVDVGSKAEIHALIGSLAARGMAVLLISSELPEVLGMSDRIAVMRAGRLQGILARDSASQDAVLSLALGHPLPPASA